MFNMLKIALGVEMGTVNNATLFPGLSDPEIEAQ